MARALSGAVGVVLAELHVWFTLTAAGTVEIAIQSRGEDGELHGMRRLVRPEALDRVAEEFEVGAADLFLVGMDGMVEAVG